MKQNEDSRNTSKIIRGSHKIINPILLEARATNQDRRQLMRDLDLQYYWEAGIRETIRGRKTIWEDYL
jgi:hypothetical protein